MTRIAVLDDDRQCLDQLVEHATHYLDAHGGGHVDAFDSPDEFLLAHRPGAYDLLVFDCVFDKDRRSGVDVLLLHQTHYLCYEHSRKVRLLYQH